MKFLQLDFEGVLYKKAELMVGVGFLVSLGLKIGLHKIVLVRREVIVLGYNIMHVTYILLCCLVCPVFLV